MPSANEFMESFKARNAAPRKVRKSARIQVKEERERVLTELRELMRDRQRTLPKGWKQGFNAAVSVLEIYK